MSTFVADAAALLQCRLSAALAAKPLDDVGQIAPATISLSAVADYLTAEIIELAGNVTIELKETELSPRHLMLATCNDSELSQLLKSCFIVDGGVLPNVHMFLQPRRERHRASAGAGGVVAPDHGHRVDLKYGLGADGATGERQWLNQFETEAGRACFVCSADAACFCSSANTDREPGNGEDAHARSRSEAVAAAATNCDSETAASTTALALVAFNTAALCRLAARAGCYRPTDNAIAAVGAQACRTLRWLVYGAAAAAIGGFESSCNGEEDSQGGDRSDVDLHLVVEPHHVITACFGALAGRRSVAGSGADVGVAAMPVPLGSGHMQRVVGSTTTPPTPPATRKSVPDGHVQPRTATCDHGQLHTAGEGSCAVAEGVGLATTATFAGATLGPPPRLHPFQLSFEWPYPLSSSTVMPGWDQLADDADHAPLKSEIVRAFLEATGAHQSSVAAVDVSPEYGHRVSIWLALTETKESTAAMCATLNEAIAADEVVLMVPSTSLQGNKAGGPLPVTLEDKVVADAGVTSITAMCASIRHEQELCDLVLSPGLLTPLVAAIAGECVGQCGVEAPVEARIPVFAAATVSLLAARATFWKIVLQSSGHLVHSPFALEDWFGSTGSLATSIWRTP
jgi:hypothetical protein